jgi:hypothetical protein
VFELPLQPISKELHLSREGNGISGNFKSTWTDVCENEGYKIAEGVGGIFKEKKTEKFIYTLLFPCYL